MKVSALIPAIIKEIRAGVAAAESPCVWWGDVEVRTPAHGAAIQFKLSAKAEHNHDKFNQPKENSK